MNKTNNLLNGNFPHHMVSIDKFEIGAGYCELPFPQSAFFDHAGFCGCGINPARNPARSRPAKYFEKNSVNAGSRKCDYDGL
jgi:hypothetical protein